MKTEKNLQFIYEEMTSHGLPTAKFPYNLKKGDIIIADVSRWNYPYRFGTKEEVTVDETWENGFLSVLNSKGELFKIKPEEVLRRV